MKVYFRNLDGLRFIAALFVILEHVSEYKTSIVPGYSNVFKYNFSDLGRYGVTLFFVLSGFLITYLLHQEFQKNNTISIQKFYLRRILRTWPLYLTFGTIVICFINLILKKTAGDTFSSPIATNLAYLFTFSINFQLLFGVYNRGIFEIAWSICIEEQFYLIWPWCIKFGFKKIYRIIFIFILIAIASGVIFHLLISNNLIYANRNPLYIFTVCRFSHLCIGALAAFFLFNKERFKKLIDLTKNRIFQGIILLLTLLLSFRIINLPLFVDAYFLDVIPAVLFSFIILSAVGNNFLFNLEGKWLKLFGSFSYGIYLFHPSIAQLTLFLFKKNIKNNFLNYELLYVIVVLALTIVVAGLSYHIFEKRFLLLKNRFTIIKSKVV